MKLRKLTKCRYFLGLVPLVIVVNIYLLVHFINSCFRSSCDVIKLEDIPLHLVAVKPNLSSNPDLCPVAVLHPQYDLTISKTNITSKKLNVMAVDLNVRPGGSWKPPECVSPHHVAIIVPYRDRVSHLRIFLAHMHPFLQAQRINYQIFVVEQNERRPFNRGKLFNIGFVEAMKISDFHCVILHDVDLLPLNRNNIYGCTGSPRHMSAFIDIYNYELPYTQIFGGAVAILKDQFAHINGFSNTFYGWGGEDDDFYERVISNFTKICRFDSTISRYSMLHHQKEKPSDDRFYFLNSGQQRYKTDGLNSLKYIVLKLKFLPLFTWILVDL